MMTSMPRALLSATSATLVVPQSTVMISDAPEGDRGVERRHRQPVALVEPARHVRLHRDAEAAQGEGHDRQPGQPVRVEVAEDEDLLPAIACRAHPQQHDRRIREGRRVVQALERVGEPGDQVLRR